MNEIYIRRSVRKYLDKPVEKEKLEKLLRAAMQAPSATDQRPWEFIVTCDKDVIKKLSSFSPFATPLKNAPAAVVVLEKEGVRAQELAQQDLGACTENLLLEAVTQGLGAVWMGVGKDNRREKYLIDMFRLPRNIRPFGVIAIGYPRREDANHLDDRYDEKRVHWDKY